jgi:hypothetical protein
MTKKHPDDPVPVASNNQPGSNERDKNRGQAMRPGRIDRVGDGVQQQTGNLR